MNLLDAVLLGILGFSIYKGYKKGVIGALSSVTGYVLGLFAAILLYRPVADFLSFHFKLESKLAPWVTENLGLPATAFETKISDLAMGQATEIISQQNIPQIFKDVMVDFVEQIFTLPLTKGIVSLGDGITYIISNYLITGIIFLGLFSCLVILFRSILPKLFKTVSPQPVTAIDKLGGAALGALGGTLTVGAFMVFLVLLGTMGAMKGNESPLANLLKNSFLVTTFMSHSESMLLKLIFSGKKV